MSVRSSILAVLTLGCAYGLQVHSEIERRTGRAGEINVGQIYSTLSRLRGSGLVTVRDATDDGLPLYELTPDGRSEAERWLTSAQPDVTRARSGWNDMIDHLLLATSMPDRDSDRLIAQYRRAWRELCGEAATPERTIRDSADRMLAEAALAWIDELGSRPDSARALSAERPRRGRRPAVTTT